MNLIFIFIKDKHYSHFNKLWMALMKIIFLTFYTTTCLMVWNDMQNDQELIKEYQNGDRSAFDKIVRRHLSNTIGFFYTITQDRMVSEDLAQDVFFKLFRHLKKFRFKSSFSTYLYRINHWLSIWRIFWRPESIKKCLQWSQLLQML